MSAQTNPSKTFQATLSTSARQAIIYVNRQFDVEACSVFDYFLGGTLVASISVSSSDTSSPSTMTWTAPTILTSIAALTRDRYSAASFTAIKIDWVSGSGLAELIVSTNGSAASGGTVSSPSIVQLASLLAGEDQDINRMLVEERLNYWVRTTGIATTNARSGANVLARVVVEVTLTGTVTVYDSLTATGTVVLILPIGFPAGVYTFNIPMGVGTTYVTSAADRVCFGGR